MRRFFYKTATKVGLSPGSAVHVGEKKAEKIRIRVIEYDEKHLVEKEVDSISECLPFLGTKATTWINVDGLHETKLFEDMGKSFDIHPLIIEDILHTNQRPKVEEFDKYIFAVLRMFRFNEETTEFQSDQFSLVLRSDCLITFQEAYGKVFEPVRNRIRSGKGRIRKMGTDYLAYALLDTIVDNYFVILEKVSEKIEKLDEEVTNSPSSPTLKEIHKLKSGITYLRKSMWPLRELVGTLMRVESKLIGKDTQIYLKDLYDHTMQVAESLDTFREMVAGLLEVYLSNQSNRMNEIMKVLTIFAAIFIPLTFVAGIYGMNFEFMPELRWHYSYPIVLGIMLIAASIMLIFFKRKRWL